MKLFSIFPFSWFKKGRPVYRKQRRLDRAIDVVTQKQEALVEASAPKMGKSFSATQNLNALAQEEAIVEGMGAALAEVNRRTGPATSELATIMHHEAAQILAGRAKVEADKIRIEEICKEECADHHALSKPDLEHLAKEKAKLKSAKKKTLKMVAKARKKGQIPKGRPSYPRLSKLLTVVLEIIAIAGEYAANYQLVSMLLREDGLTAKLFALGLSVILIVGSHKLGLYVAKMGQGKWAKGLFALKASLAFFGVAIALGMLRAAMVEDQGQWGDDPWTRWSVIAMIAFMPTAAFWMAILSYDPLHDIKVTYGRLMRKLTQTKGRLAKIEKQKAGIKTATTRKVVKSGLKARNDIAALAKDNEKREAKHLQALTRANKALNVTLAIRKHYHSGIQQETRELVHKFRGKVLESLDKGQAKLPTWFTREFYPAAPADEDTVLPAEEVIGKLPDVQIRKAGGKGLLTLLLLCSSLLLGLSGCTEEAPERERLVSMEVLTDHTDSALVASPLITGAAIAEVLNLDREEERPLATVNFTEIGASAFAPSTRERLGAQGRENEYNNEDSCRAFANRLSKRLAHCYRPIARESEHSRIYIALCEALTRLTEQDAQRKILIVHSDYLEHCEEVSFYREAKTLASQPASLERRLAELCTLPRLDGIEAYLLTTATDGDDALIIDARSFFREMLTSKGATVHYAIHD